MTVVLFDDRYELLYNNVDVQKVKKITSDEWSPRGMTALYDAIGRTINDVSREIKKLEKSERPDKILVAIVTDGQENASKEYNSEDIKKLIKKKEEKDWKFVFLAANQDAFAVGSSLNISGGNTFTYTNTSHGNTVMFSALSNATAKYRGVSKSDVAYAAVANSLLSDVDDQNVSGLNNISSNGSGSITTGNVTFTTTTGANDVLVWDDADKKLKASKKDQ
jgi:uncharacterized protein YegL